MKKLFYPLAILLLITPATLKAQTSTYHAFPDSAAQWNIYYNSGCLTGDIIDEYSIEMTEDTIINNKNYHSLKVFYIDSINVGFCNGYSSNKIGYQGAIREDTALKHVYFVPADSSHEVLLYDFNLSVGDTIEGYLASETKDSHPDSIIVEAIDSVLVNGNYHKRWKMGAGNNYLIEGIGSTFGLIEPLSPNIIDLHWYELRCASIQGITVYPDSLNSCQTITGLNQLKKIKNQSVLYPNPFKQKLSIKSDVLIQQLKLYSINGKLIQEVNVDAKSYNWSPKVDAGIYFLKITDQKGNSSIKKLIKTE